MCPVEAAVQHNAGVWLLIKSCFCGQRPGALESTGRSVLTGSSRPDSCSVLRSGPATCLARSWHCSVTTGCHSPLEPFLPYLLHCGLAHYEPVILQQGLSWQLGAELALHWTYASCYNLCMLAINFILIFSTFIDHFEFPARENG